MTRIESAVTPPAAVTLPACVTVKRDEPPTCASKRLAVCPTTPFTTSSLVPAEVLLTWNWAPGELVPSPSRPSLVRRRRSLPSVAKVIALLPAADNAISPAEPPVVASVRLPVLETDGVVTEVLADTVFAASDVKVPAAGVLLPIVVPLIVPPPIAMLLVWNWPAAVRIARTRSSVTKRIGWASRMPKNRPVAVCPILPPLVIPVLPASSQVASFDSCENAICDKRPSELATTTRS